MCSLLNVREFCVLVQFVLFFPQNSMYVVSALMLKVKYSVVTDVYLNNYNIV